MRPADNTFRNQTVRLADLTVVSDVITGLTFENCTVIGPAVVVPLGGTVLSNSAFEGPQEATIWDIGDREYTVGAIGLDQCEFYGCRFQRIGIAVRSADLDNLLRGFS